MAPNSHFKTHFLGIVHPTRFSTTTTIHQSALLLPRKGIKMPIVKLNPRAPANPKPEKPKYLSLLPPIVPVPRSSPPPCKRNMYVSDDLDHRDNALFDMERLGIKPEDRSWFRAVNIEIRKFMSGDKPSQSYQYTRRIVSNAARILEKEKKKQKWFRTFDPVPIFVACMVSEVGAAEYVTENWDHDQVDIIDDFLKPLGCPAPIRHQAAFLASRVSATAKLADKDTMNAFAQEYPNFRVIHDAHRLDWLGAVGVSRLLLGQDTGESRQWNEIDGDIKLLEECFGHYSRLMMTDAGKKMAEKRYKWMVEAFLIQWKCEEDTSNV